jgi:hypothetical protein
MFDADLNALVELDESGPAAGRDEMRATIQARMRAAARGNSANLAAWVRSLSPHDASDANRLSDLYETLAPDAIELEAFFAEEADRLLAACEAQPRSVSAFTAILSLMFLEKHAPESLRRRLRERYALGLRSSSASVRRACVDLIGGHEVSKDAAARSAVEACLQDSDWRVRALAESTLAGEGLLPKGYTVPLLDRVRRSMFDWTKYV